MFSMFLDGILLTVLILWTEQSWISSVFFSTSVWIDDNKTLHTVIQNVHANQLVICKRWQDKKKKILENEWDWNGRDRTRQKTCKRFLFKENLNLFFPQKSEWVRFYFRVKRKDSINCSRVWFLVKWELWLIFPSLRCAVFFWNIICQGERNESVAWNMEIETEEREKRLWWERIEQKLLWYGSCGIIMENWYGSPAHCLYFVLLCATEFGVCKPYLDGKFTDWLERYRRGFYFIWMSEKEVAHRYSLECHVSAYILTSQSACKC